jgi:exopolysaccharide biosynthesis polyprenyl glycosylphosphotransferase
MRTRPLPTVLLVGTGPMAWAVAEEIRRHGKQAVAGTLSLEGERTHAELGVPVLGGAESLLEHLCTLAIEKVVIAADVATHRDEIQRALATCEEVGVAFSVPAHPFRLTRASHADAHVGDDGFLHFQTSIQRPLQSRLKRALDLAASAAGLLALSPLLIAIAAAIKLASPGPVLFRQVRVGRFGARFVMYKFRSMRVDAEAQLVGLRERNEQGGPVFKMRRDPRVTPIGRILRRFSLDELPQLFNVLIGDMSLVGPRPPLPAEVAQYEPWQRRRLSVRPGLTCIWQVEGRNDIGFLEWMYLDMLYVDEWSFAGDLRLLLRTIPAVATGRGAS